MTTTRSYGAKFNATLSTKEIAAAVREDIKAEVKAGRLPKAKYSVRIQVGTLYASITVRVGGLTGMIDRSAYSIRSGALWANKPGCMCVTQEVSRVERALDSLLNAYNYDGSQVEVDYFDVNFYGHVLVDTSGELKALEAELLAAEREPVGQPRKDLVAATGW